MKTSALLLLALLFAGCSEHQPSQFEIEGLPKKSVLEHLGEPSRETLLKGWQIKTSMGPKPKLAHTMADEDTVTMWQYPVTDNRAAQLFFDSEGVVSEVIIFRADVMY